MSCGAHIEVLELRRLLTVINGTSGDDVIIMTCDRGIFSSTVHVNVNGVVTDYTENSGAVPFDIEAGDGNDSIEVRKTDDHQEITVNGGRGNDRVTIGDGDWADNCSGDIVYQEPINSLGGGTDQLVLDDTFGNGTQYQFLGPEVVDEQQTLSWTNNLEAVQVLGSQQNDNFILDALDANTSVNGGSGDDRFILGGSEGHVFSQESLKSGTIDGNVGSDSIIVDESTAGPFAILIGATIFDNTVNMKNIENLQLHARPEGLWTSFSDSNSFARNVSIYGTSGDDRLDFGGSTNTPISLDQLQTAVDFEGGGGNDQINVFNSGPNGLLFDAPSIIDGPTSIRSPGTTKWLIHESDTVQRNTIQAIQSNWNVSLNGGGGDDIIVTSFAGTNESDLAAIFKGVFTFDGGAGNDTASLDDSMAATIAGDLNDNYNVTATGVTKTETNTFIGLAHIETLGVSTDANPNLVRFYSMSGVNNLSLDVGPDALVTNTSPGLSVGNIPASVGAVSTTLNAAPGVVLDLDDSINGLPMNYTLNPLSSNQAKLVFNVMGNPLSMSFQTLNLPTLDLNGTNFADQFHLNGKPAGLAVSLSGGDGNDAFVVGGGDLDSNGWIHTTLGGANGNDSIEFDDHADLFSNTETEDYTLAVQELTKGATADVIYGSMESQQLDASTVGNGLASTGEIVNLNNVSLPTTVASGARACFVEVGTGDLSSSVFAPVTVNQGLAGGVFVNDQNSTVGKTYTLSAGTLAVSPGQTIHFSGDGLSLNAGSGNDTINVTGTGNVMPIVVNAGGGNDTITVGGGDLDLDFLSTVSVNGGAGTDVLTFDNSGDASAETQTLTGSTYTTGSSPTFSFSAIESLQFNNGSGGGPTFLNSVTLPMTIQGGAGPDVINIGGGHLLSSQAANVFINGGGGNDQVILDDSADTAATDLSFTAGNVFKEGTAIGARTVRTSNVEAETLRAGTGDDVISVTNNSLDLLILSGPGNDTVSVADSATPVTVNTGSESPKLLGSAGDALVLNPNNDTLPSAAKVIGVDHIANVLVKQLGVLQVLPASTLDVTDSFAVAGTIDLAGGAMVVRNGATTFSAIQAAVKKGYAGGAWNGTGLAIDSSLAHSSSLQDGVGLGPALNVFGTFPATFAGITNIDAGCALLRYTLNGDANLDQQVDVSDLGTVATNWQNTGKNFTQGDFNYDGTVDVTDLGSLATNWQQSLSAASPATSGNSIPATSSMRVIDQTELE